jgi:hypothetical protein
VKDRRREHRRVPGGSEPAEPAYSLGSRSAYRGRLSGSGQPRLLPLDPSVRHLSKPHPRGRIHRLPADRDLGLLTPDPSLDERGEGLPDPLSLATIPDLRLIRGAAVAPSPSAARTRPTVANLDPGMPGHESTIRPHRTTRDSARQLSGSLPQHRAASDTKTTRRQAHREKEKTAGNQRFLRRPAEGEGFEPSIRLTTDNGFRDRRIRPLCHPSWLVFSLAVRCVPSRGGEQVDVVSRGRAWKAVRPRANGQWRRRMKALPARVPLRGPKRSCPSDVLMARIVTDCPSGRGIASVESRQ